MKHYYWMGLLLAVLIGTGEVDAATDAAYTGTTNSATSTPPAPVKHKKKKTKTASTTTEQAASTNSVEKPVPPVASTNTAPAEISPPVSTNAPAATEPSKPVSAAQAEAAPDKPATNSVVKPSAPASTNAVAATPPSAPVNRVATLTTADLKEYGDQPPRVQALITHGLELTAMNLKYEYGSADPSKGGMDCSGTVYYLLKQSGLKDVPRDASELYTWVWKQTHVVPVTSSNLDTFELSKLKPGDLLFWSGTYDIQRDPPITHVMIYLGTNRATGKRVMVGASEGRTYEGKSRYGVSVFDFVLPKPPTKSDGSTSRFIGYGQIPGL